MSDSKFAIGDIVKHKLFGYHGVIYDVDAIFMGSDDWYETVAKTRPPKDEPWYRVLVDNQDIETYVSERNLEKCSKNKINHPLVATYFKESESGGYVSRRLPA